MSRQSEQSTPHRPIKLLLIEHEAVSRLSLTELLTADGYSVVSTARGEDALQKLRTNRFDALITDSGAGRDVSGSAIISEFERLQPGKPKLLITAHPLSTVREEGFRATYVSKPIQPEEFLLTLKSVLGR
ncbi:MAG TPA: response regulator [Candidatus Eisenbacteria bacterium]|nr:response regulator [Candidatus Eisenbacteria bacterium]